MNSTIETGALIAVVYAMVRVIELLLQRVIVRKNGNCGDSRKMAEQIDKLHEAHSHSNSPTIQRGVETLLDMHAKFDEDGTPLWYVPRSWQNTQDKIIESQNRLIEVMRGIASTNEKVAATLERLERRDCPKAAG